jgi:hypothetical protein
VEFETKDPESITLTKIIQRIDQILGQRNPIDISFARIAQLCREGFSKSAGYFPDTGTAERLFATSFYSPHFDGATLAKRVELAHDRPDAIGKAILAQSADYMRTFGVDADANLQFVFILFARYFFDQFYVRSIGPALLRADSADFSARVRTLRSLSPLGFGIGDDFVREQHKSIPLALFPAANDYAAATDLFRVLQFQTCPIDFCKAGHDALKRIQQVASETSFSTKQLRTGKLYAKSDHLLCLDELFDVALLVLLLSEPAPLQPLVDAFEPFIVPLEMTAELEFAFTNISAMVRHIAEIDIEKFCEDAKKRMEQAMEIDPLSIMP